jgi:ABC-type multidrug transport system fused ATPase/permease subunit
MAALNPCFHLSACHHCTVKVVWEFCSQSHQSDAKEGKSLGICCGHSHDAPTNTLIYNLQLADGNSVSEAAISSMPTVRAFDAAPTEFKEFEACMEKYLSLNMKAAVAYSGYATCVTSLPQLVTALVVFYGGLMVRNGDMTSGELVSFLLYLQSLSDAFASIGYIYSSLSQAVGAADKGK